MKVHHDDIKLSHNELEHAYNFMHQALNFYTTGRERASVLSGIRDALGSKFFTESSPVGSSFRPDGLIDHQTRLGTAYTCIQELKNEIGEGNSDPIRQAEYDYVAICSSENVRIALRYNTPNTAN